MVFMPDTVRANYCWYALARLLCFLSGWKVQGPPPPFEKYVAVFAPHTALRDTPVAIMICFALRLKGVFLIKDSVYRGPLKLLFDLLGGFPVVRGGKRNFVEQVADEFERRDHMILALAPEGTREKTDHWKSGFYYIAQAAQVPIVLAFWDYEKKVGGNSGVYIMPGGEVEADLKIIRDFYAGVHPKHEALRSVVRFQEKG